MSIPAHLSGSGAQWASKFKHLQPNSLRKGTGNFFNGTGNFGAGTGNFTCQNQNHRKRPFLARLFWSRLAAICSHIDFAGEDDEMADDNRPHERYGEAFWRVHHEAWRRSELNQREYCEAHGIPLKAFGNWRAKFKAEPQLQARKLLYRRGGRSADRNH